MSTACIDDFILEDGITCLPGQNGDIIENQDGSSMFTAEFVTVSQEEVSVNLHPNSPLTFGKGLGLAVSTFIAVGLMVWAAYSQVQTQISEVRTEVSTLRSDNREDFNRANDKQDKVIDLLTEMRLEQAKKQQPNQN